MTQCVGLSNWARSVVPSSHQGTAHERLKLDSRGLECCGPGGFKAQGLHRGSHGFRCCSGLRFRVCKGSGQEC